MLISLSSFRYIISQAVADKRHADNKSSAAEHVGFHAALRPLLEASLSDGLDIAEVVTDQCGQIMADLSKC